MELLNSYAALGSAFYERTLPADVKNPRLHLWNRALAEELNLPSDMTEDESRIAQIFSGSELYPGFDPIATAYAGHQFGNFVPQLGDGRAHLLCEIKDKYGKGRDVQLKGSGRTRFSRNGDGLCALGPAVREFIMSEAMHFLGVPTARTLAVVGTGETVFREADKPGAVVTRIASSHIRVGTFEYFSAREDLSSLETLLNYTIHRHYPEIDGKSREEKSLGLIHAAIEKQIRLISEWMRIGFIHGVMNTDNTALSGETIDFGPCAMMDSYDPDTVFSSIDRNGRYSFGKQPAILQWNMARFAETLLPLIDEDQEKAVNKVLPYIKSIPEKFEQTWQDMMRRKLGILRQEEGDRELIFELLRRMKENKSDYTNTFDLLTRIMENKDRLYESGEQLKSAGIYEWHDKWENRLKHESSNDREKAELMRKNNPRIIPRNHRVEEAIEEAETSGTFNKTERLLSVLQSPYQLNDADEEYRDPPADGGRDYVTFCGT